MDGLESLPTEELQQMLAARRQQLQGLRSEMDAIETVLGGRYARVSALKKLKRLHLTPQEAAELGLGRKPDNAGDQAAGT